jgi:hypothetical protein
MFRMTKTEAAKTMAVEIRCYARKHGLEVTKSLVEERISELSGYHYRAERVSYQTQAATIANVKTTLREALSVPL